MAKHGQLSQNGYTLEEAARATAGFSTWRTITMSTATVVDGYGIVSSNYPGMLLVGFHNPTAGDATIIAKDAEDDSEVTLFIPTGGALFPLPPIGKIKQTGTTDGIVGFFLKR